MEADRFLVDLAVRLLAQLRSDPAVRVGIVT